MSLGFFATNTFSTKLGKIMCEGTTVVFPDCAYWPGGKSGVCKCTTLDPLFSLRPYSAVSFPMDILHVHFEVVIPCKLLVAELALCHGPVGVVSQLMSDQHLLQAEGQVTNLRQPRQDKDTQSTEILSMCNTPKVTSLRPQPHIPAVFTK